MIERKCKCSNEEMCLLSEFGNKYINEKALFFFKVFFYNSFNTKDSLEMDFNETYKCSEFCINIVFLNICNRFFKLLFSGWVIHYCICTF